MIRSQRLTPGPVLIHRTSPCVPYSDLHCFQGIISSAAARVNLRVEAARARSFRPLVRGTRLAFPPAGSRPAPAQSGRRVAISVVNAASAAQQSGEGDGPINAVIKALYRAGRSMKRTLRWARAVSENPDVRITMQYIQFAASLLFVVLYVWGTYTAAPPASLRNNLDMALCIFFGLEYLHRLVTEESKLRMVTSFWNMCDLMAFAPPLLELTLRSFHPSFSFSGLDLRWFKMLRSMRVLRIGLLASELRSLHLSTSRGGLLGSGANFRLFQLLGAVCMLLFSTTSVVQILERMPFHQAMYFVMTTLTTVGYGDVVAKTLLGKAVVLGMICLGVVLIPVQAAQVYQELAARRMVLGSLPDWSTPWVLLSTRLSEVRAFSDLFAEFQQALKQSRFPRNTKMVVLGARPSFEFRAFQELHERRVSLMEGSAVSGQDLVGVRAEKAQACLLLADRFTTDPEQEDLSILFQVWAVKSYTKRVPLFVQTVRQSTVRQIAPFLDPGQDVVVSMEQTRFRLLALNAVCPGASTLIVNLLRSSAVIPLESQQPTLAGRKWLRAYVNGCAHQFFEVPVPPHLVGQQFIEVAAWLYWTSGFVLAAVICSNDSVRVNPSCQRLAEGETLLVVGTKKRHVLRALGARFALISGQLRQEAQAWGKRWEEEEEGRRREVGKEAAPAPAGQGEGAAGGHRAAVPAAGKTVEDECVPGWTGNPDSDSWDPDTLPCDPPLPNTPDLGDTFMRQAAGGDSLQDSLPDASQQSMDISWENSMATASGAPPQPAAGQAGAAQQADTSEGAARSRPGGTNAVAQGGTSIASPFTGSWAQGRGAVTAPACSTAVSPGPPSEGPTRAAAAPLTQGPGVGGGSTPTRSRGRGRDGEGGSTLCSLDWEEGVEGAAEHSGPSGGREPSAPLSNHFIVCGNEEGFCTFIGYLRQCCGPRAVPVVVLHPHRPESLCEAEQKLGPIKFVQGSPADAPSLRAAGASRARALVYLARSARPVKSAQATGSGIEKVRTSREAVLADAEALLACYGVGEESGTELTHAVVELLFTTSIEFLQPGLLLKGVNLVYEEGPGGGDSRQPRKSWLMRTWQQREAVGEGLAEWQANPYYVAGRVTVPALMDTFACQCFFNRGVLVDLLGELSGCEDLEGEEGGPGGEGSLHGALLQQIPVPPGMAGRGYGECFLALALSRQTLCLGLHRRKSENPGTRLSYVVTNPPWQETLEASDRIFVLQSRPRP